MNWLWTAGAVLLAVAAAAAWFAFQRPDFVAGLAAMAAGALWKALAPAFMRAIKTSPETVDANKERTREGLPPVMGKAIDPKPIRKGNWTARK